MKAWCAWEYDNGNTCPKIAAVDEAYCHTHFELDFLLYGGA